LDALRLYRPASESIWCHIELRESGVANAGIVTTDLRLINDAGEPLARLEGLRLKRVDAAASAPRDCCYEVEWRETERVASAALAGTWLVWPGDGELAREVTREVERRGGVCLPAEVSALPATDTLRGVIYLAPTQEPQPCGELLKLVQSLVSHAQPNPTRLCVVTRGADAVSGPPFLAHAPLAGMTRVIALEHPELRTLRVDVNAADPAIAASHIADEVAVVSSSDQVAYRDGVRYVPRLTRTVVAAADDHPVRLEKSGGLIDALSLHPHARRAPGPGEVEIRVRAAGLNFRDVLNALDTYPGDAGPLGCECAGEIVAVGEGVRGLAPGDEVLALASGCFGTYAVTRQELAVRKPSRLTWEQACAIPIAFLTAHYALRVLGRLSRGQKVLIHAAAGGVGLAAVQLAHRMGAEVFATAGSPVKREHLRSLGITHLMDSRSLTFSTEILEATRGEGVDLVLNSLSGEFIPHSLSTLRRGGCFLEIGKTGIWSAARVREARADVEYHTIALDGLTLQDPVLVGAMLREIVEQVESGDLQPLPSRTFPLDDAPSAFRYMAQAKHTGKVVLTTPGVHFSSDATYLIAGGLGGLGLVTAGWMADSGAKNLVLIGRGAPSGEARKSIDELVARGVRVVIARADIARRDELSSALDRALSGLPPLRGVVHSAGVLDDGVLTQQTSDRFAGVLAPKVQGAWNLHDLTLDAPLEFFVLYSSVAALFGSPGQSSYAAGNAFLDALAHNRRAQGRPAVSINWGPWSEVGLAARLNLDRSMARRGMSPFSPGQAKQLLPALFRSRAPQVAAAMVKWPVFLAQFPAGAVPSFFETVAHHHTAVSESLVPPVLGQLENATASRRRDLLRDHVNAAARKVLGLERLDDRQRLLETGMDSLMAVELRNLLQQTLARSLPTTIVFEYPTVAALAAYLDALLFPETAPSSSVPGTTDIHAIEEFSDSSLVALLESKLVEIESQEIT
jgi:NADPH:quinone reductase-like Zn-dependent oxidoreductase/NADP-dependent 3-hydroxy acid dehydrogenase YdfG